MYTRKNWFTVVLLLCLGAGAKAQQSVQFSQYIFNGLSVNPAYAGYKDVMYLNATFRNQWTGYPGAPKTGMVSLDGPLRRANRETNVGLGVQAMFDKLGPQSAISIYGSYAYRIRLDDEDTKRVSFGVGFGATQYGLDGTQLEYLDQGDRIVPDGTAKETAPDIRLGVYYYSPTFYFGISAMDLISKYTSSGYKWRGYTYESIRRRQSVYLTAGYMYQISDELSLKPSAMFKTDFAGPAGLDLNMMLYIDNLLWIGGSYRTNVPVLTNKAVTASSPIESANAASAILEYYITSKYRIGYSYDINLNKMAGQQSGSHEISIGILFNSKQYSTSNPRYF